MIVDELFEFYKKELTFYAKVTIVNSKILNFILILWILIYLICFYFVIFEQKYLLSILGIGSFFLVYYIQVRLNTKVIKDKFPEMYISKLEWDSIKFDELFLKKLSEKLADIKPDLDLIQSQIADKAARGKTTNIIKTSILGALFVPLWSSYISEIMGVFKSDINQLTTMLIIFSILILATSYLGYLVIELRDNNLSDYHKWNKLNDLITDYRIRKMDSPVKGSLVT